MPWLMEGVASQWRVEEVLLEVSSSAGDFDTLLLLSHSVRTVEYFTLAMIAECMGTGKYP